MNDKRRISDRIVVAVCMLALFSLPVLCFSANTLTSTETPRQVAVSSLPPPMMGPYHIVVGDVIDVSFFKTPELNQTRTVGPDGQVSLMLIGSLTVAGRTVDKLTEELTQQYAKELVDPQVNLSVKEFAGLRIYVGGEVHNPGMFPYRGGLTLVQAVMNAGGHLPSARLNEVVLIRKGPDSRPVGSIVNVKEILYKAQFADDLQLAPSDIVFLPRSKIANVNVWVDQYIRKNIPFNLWLGFSLR